MAIGQYINPVQGTSPDGIAPIPTVAQGGPLGEAVSGFDSANGVLRVIRVDAAGAVITTGGGGGAASLNTFTGAAPTFVTAGVGSAALVAANAARKYLFITVTTPGASISLGLDGAAAVLNRGITVFTGTPVEFDASAISVGAVTVIANMAGVNVSIQEGS